MPDRLIQGLRRFHRETFPRYREHYRRLVEEGQNPGTLFIGCSDSRIVPDLLMGTGPGELFIVRNMGAFVPPFETDQGFHGTSAGIEFAVLTLRVTDIVVCGHSHCGAIRALYDPPNPATPHIVRWLELARQARIPGPEVEGAGSSGNGPGSSGEGPGTEPASVPPDPDVLRRSEQRSVAIQLERLLGYPMVRERVEEGSLSLHGWHYVIEDGRVLALDVDRRAFLPLGD